MSIKRNMVTILTKTSLNLDRLFSTPIITYFIDLYVKYVTLVIYIYILFKKLKIIYIINYKVLVLQTIYIYI